MAVDEEASVAEAELEEEPLAELDLDLDDVAAGEGPGDGSGALRGSRVRWTGARAMVAVALTGALLGGGLVQVAQSTRERGRTTVSVALGEAGAGALNRRLGSLRVIRLSTVALNEGGSAVTIRAVRVEGDGVAPFRTSRGEATLYPFQLAPGETGSMPLALFVDCQVPAPRAPGLQIDVTAEDGTQRTLDLRIRGLDELWRRDAMAQACSDS